MADQLNMNNLSLKDSQHAPNGQANGGFERTAYIPPHMRGRGGPPSSDGFDNAAPAANGMNGSAWAPQSK